MQDLLGRLAAVADAASHPEIAELAAIVSELVDRIGAVERPIPATVNPDTIGLGVRPETL